ncbi:MAG TPA: DUF1501 domain-containing protein [Pirellulales bacterium]|nr:DUF1501 domain-containing protein [Pirellulales bacterium]
MPRLRAAESAVPRQRNCIFIVLQGGPSHIDLWDPKPRASEELRGPFPTIETKVPGLRFTEMLPGSAQVADKLCVIRSMTHKFTNHIAGTYIAMTGSTNQPDRDREAHADDFPGPGAVLNYLQKGTPAVPRSISLPNWLSIPGPSNRMPGQFGGFLGNVHNPFLIEGDPSQPDFRPLSLSLPPGMSPGRMQTRLDLAKQLDTSARLIEKDLDRQYDRLRHSAYELVVDSRVRQALDLSQEPAALRDRYGRTKFGQSLLLARRLIEAGVQYVAYNCFNQEWDTHGGLPHRYAQIVPPMDAAFSALVDDLATRNRLEDTLVINTGEFGRTPVVNKDAGRDHWPNVYSCVLAGGGLRGGYVHGASDAKGAEVLEHPTSPADVLATMWHQLGISPTTELHDRLNRPMQLSEGRVLDELRA